jgi:hypothetical protein
VEDDEDEAPLKLQDPLTAVLPKLPHLRMLTEDQVRSLDAAAIASLSSAQFGSLGEKPELLRSLSKPQLAAVTQEVLSVLVRHGTVTRWYLIA